MRRLLPVAAGAALALTLLAAPASAGGGNSQAAKACQDGGFADYQRTDGTAFANEGACTSYAARGGTLVVASQPTITFDQRYRSTDAIGVLCGVYLIMEDYAPSTTYDVFLYLGTNPFYFTSVTTDANGDTFQELFGAYEGRTVDITVAGITTPLLIDC